MKKKKKVTGKNRSQIVKDEYIRQKASGLIEEVYSESRNKLVIVKDIKYDRGSEKRIMQ